MQTAFTARSGSMTGWPMPCSKRAAETPTPIQAQAIPVVLNGRDVIGSAQTGTGKTAAFSLPILQKLEHPGTLRCLVLEPTRELALQVEESFNNYSKYTGLRTTVIYGGVGYGKQREELARGTDVIVATPGRLPRLHGARGNPASTGCRFWCSTRSTACSTWVSCPT